MSGHYHLSTRNFFFITNYIFSLSQINIPSSYILENVLCKIDCFKRNIKSKHVHSFLKAVQVGGREGSCTNDYTPSENESIICPRKVKIKFLHICFMLVWLWRVKAGQPLEAMIFELSHEGFQQKDENREYSLSTENMSQSGGKRRAFWGHFCIITVYMKNKGYYWEWQRPWMNFNARSRNIKLYFIISL